MIDGNDKIECGMDVVLYISNDSEEYLEESRIEELLKKYCWFLFVLIKFGIKIEFIIEGEGDDVEIKEIEVDNIINNIDLIWRK